MAHLPTPRLQTLPTGSGPRLWIPPVTAESIGCPHPGCHVVLWGETDALAVRALELHLLAQHDGSVTCGQQKG